MCIIIIIIIIIIIKHYVFSFITFYKRFSWSQEEKIENLRSESSKI